MYLVDTSVWIDYLRGRAGPHIDFLRDLLENPLAVVITHSIYLEILRGARDEASFDRLREYFGGQRFATLEDPLTSHEAAARIYLDCRRRGVTVRSGFDCLIAQSAIEADLTVLHHDRDFGRIAAVVPALREKSFLH